MQKENTSFDLLTTTSAADASPLHFSRSNPFLSPTSRTDYLNSDASLYSSSLFQKYHANALSDAASFDGGDADRHFHDSSSILEYQQLYNRYTLCLSRLRDSMEEIDALRRENESLRLSNADLSHRVALLFSRERLLSELNRLSVASPPAAAPVPVPVPVPVHVATPQPLAERNCFERRNPEKIALPKSISVRSKGYLKTMNRSAGRDFRETSLQKTVSHPSPPSQQRVYVPGAKEKEDALEFDVYNQGMFKTELCNKWEETGACPYGENCQFAHGIKELRPVIRHPRYKTEVCRMVLAGDACPYGHRCHFRHSLTEEERLMAAEAAAPLRPPPPR
ncbi:Zinc finger C-x8-C-x5-C-x3-H type family protein [Perilla frutescens var. hirtella]|uniref:Zinc finger C-x8-C-x5-C-x3-H type family protein n=1 Tax=Perilla frutescens var. hirtella TaxID=608512 RepID=A0AAD4INQ9_PERFH|nr:Zinc finger C-x8-C-x5-C-x3-H type family protein [Perilla frutescens var. hirtella]